MPAGSAGGVAVMGDDWSFKLCFDEKCAECEAQSRGLIMSEARAAELRRILWDLSDLKRPVGK